MSKKIIIGLAVILFFPLLLTNSADAIDFDAIYMVESTGSITAQSVFTADEDRWLYLDYPSEFPDPGVCLLTKWISPSGEEYNFDYTGSLSIDWVGDRAWAQPANWSWSDVGDYGLWTVNAGDISEDSPGVTVYGATSFYHAPEPISSLLFVTGGAVLAGRRYWKKRRST